MAEIAAAFPVRAWARLVFRPGTGILEAQGDCERVFGAPEKSLLDSREPLKIIPARLASVFSSGIPESPTLISFGSLTGVVVPLKDSAEAVLQAEVILFEIEGQVSPSAFPTDDLGAGILGLDRTGIIRLWNSTMSEMFSLPGDNPLGRSIESVLPPPVLQSWSGVVASVLEGRQVRVEMRPSKNKRIEGTFRAGGAGIVGTLFDTSEGFVIEQRLRNARRMNQAYLQTVRAGIVLFDQDYRLLLVNRAFVAMFKLHEGLEGMPLYELVPRESFTELEKLSRMLFDGEQEVPSVTVTYSDQDGVRRAIHQTFRPVRSEDEESFMVVGVFDDVTEQLQASLEADRRRARQEEMAALTAAISSSRLPADAARLAERACSALSASAAALYLFEPYSTTKLAGCSGSWSGALPDDFSDLRLPPSVWNISPCMLAGPELGILRGRVDCCCVFPMGQGSANRGFLVAGFDSPERARDSLHAGSMASDLIRLRLESSGMSSQLERLTYMLEKQRRFFRDAISMLDTPVAVFGEDWRVMHWNRAMENLTGCPSETAKKRSSMVIDMLFGPVGGVASARRIARRGLSGGAPASWEIRRVDGSVFTTSWRMARIDSAEGDVVESVTLLAGVPEPPGSGSDSDTLSNEGFDFLGRSLIRLVSARSAAQLAEALALAASGMSKGGGAVVEITSPDGAVRARHSLGSDEDTGGWSSFTIQRGPEQYGSLMVDGVSHGALLADFTRAAARVIENIDETSLGAVVSSVFAGAGSGFAVCDHAGRLIDTGAGGPESGGRREPVTVAQFFGVAEELAAEAIRTAVKQGRSAMDDGTGGTVVMSSLGVPGSPNVVFAWKAPAGAPMDLLPGHPLSGPSGLSAIAAALPEAIGRLRDRLHGISRLLAGDDPVRPEMASACLETSSLRKMSHYLALFSRCLNPCDGACRAGEVLDRLVARCVRRGRRPPDLYTEGDIPEIDMDPDILTDVLDLLYEAGSSGGQVEIRVRHSAQASTDSPSLARGCIPAVLFAISWSAAPAVRVPLGEALESACRGVFDTGTELALVGLALRMCSCSMSLGEDRLSATVSIPRI